jgi:hypothetical protein
MVSDGRRQPSPSRWSICLRHLRSNQLTDLAVIVLTEHTLHAKLAAESQALLAWTVRDGGETAAKSVFGRIFKGNSGSSGNCNPSAVTTAQNSRVRELKDAQDQAGFKLHAVTNGRGQDASRANWPICNGQKAQLNFLLKSLPNLGRTHHDTIVVDKR